MALSNKDFVRGDSWRGPDRTAGGNVGSHRAGSRGGRAARMFRVHEGRAHPTGAGKWWPSIHGQRRPERARLRGPRMTASELVDLTAKGAFGRPCPADVSGLVPTAVGPVTHWDGRGVGGGKRPDETISVWCCPPLNEGRHRRIGGSTAFQPLVGGLGRRADRARLGFHRRHRDPGDRRRARAS